MRLNRLVQIHSIHGRDVKTCDPHINHDGDFKVGFIILKGSGIGFASSEIADDSSHFYGIVFPVGADQCNFLNLNGISVKVAAFIFRGTFAFYKPFRPQRFDFVIYRPRDFAIIANEHRLSVHRGMFFTAFFIVPDKMFDDDIKPIRVAEDNLQIGHVLFRLFNLILICSGICLQAVIFVTGLGHFFVKLHFARAGQPDNSHGRTIIKGLLHGVLNNDLAKNT